MSSEILSDYIAIKNVIARYCEALDLKEFQLLHDVFMQNVTADYPFNSELKGVDAVIHAVEKRLGPIRTHHNLTTQRITFGERTETAQAVTYFQGVHFGQGPHEGEMLCAYGKYIDELVLLETDDKDHVNEGIPRSSGIWRIVRRKVEFTQRIGDEKIMVEF